METEFASRLDWNQRAYYALHGREIMVGNCRKLESRPLPLVLFVWVEREDVPGTATHGHHNLITSGYGDKLSRSTSEPLPLDGRLSRLLAAKSDRGRSLCTVAGFISNFSELDPATGRTRKSRRENGTTRESPTGMWIYILVSFDSVEIDRAKPPPIVAIRRDYRCV